MSRKIIDRYSPQNVTSTRLLQEHCLEHISCYAQTVKIQLSTIKELLSFLGSFTTMLNANILDLSQKHRHIGRGNRFCIWLKALFPTAFIEYEVLIPETGQIVDIYVKHEDGKLAGLVWAFKFQHSKITSAA